MRDAIQASDYASMMGGRVAFDKNNQAHNNAVILKVEGRQVKVVATRHLIPGRPPPGAAAPAGIDFFG